MADCHFFSVRDNCKGDVVVIFLGQNIRRIRFEKHIKQCELADKADIAVGFLSEIEAGKKKPSLDVLEKIAIALSCPIADLFFSTSVSVETEKNVNNSDELLKKHSNQKRIKLTPYMAIRDAAIDDSAYGLYEDRLEAANILRQAIRELEGSEEERSDEPQSDGVA
jgi:transcriptional regulator with XRE-family HTH domain